MTVSEEIKYLISLIKDDKLRKELTSEKINYQSLCDSASYEDETIVIKIYLRTLCIDKGLWNVAGILWDDVKQLESILIRICSEVGLYPYDNPFIDFVISYKKRNGTIKNFTVEDLITVNNLYANRDVDFDNITGKKDEIKHIIFCADFYKHSSSEKSQYVEIYNELTDTKIDSILKNIKRGNIFKITDSINKEDVKWRIIYKLNGKSSLLRNMITLNSLVDIKSFLREVKDISHDDNEKDRIVKNFKRLDVKDKKKLLKSLITNRELYDYVVQELKNVSENLFK